jgi:hypothetical protein
MIVGSWLRQSKYRTLRTAWSLINSKKEDDFFGNHDQKIENS